MRPRPWSILLLLLIPAAAYADDVRVIVGFHGKADQSVFARHGGRAATDLSSINAWAGYVPAGRLKALRAEPGILYVEEDRVRTKTVEPNDTYYNFAFSKLYTNRGLNDQKDDFRLIRCPEAWGVSTGAGARVSVLDTGCQINHVDIGSGTAGKVKVWRNFTASGTESVSENTNVSDSDGHGTHTAGTVGARTNNARGVAGAGWDCELAIGKVLGPSGGYDSWVAAGIAWSWQTAGAKVISMSLGGQGSSTTLDNAIEAAWSGGAVLVAAAGNDGADGSNHYPSAHPNCISVAAVNEGGQWASFSNYGPTTDIAAPGVTVLSTYPTDSYAWASGTSMATPHVAGVAALAWSAFPSATNAFIRSQVERGGSRWVTAPDGGVIKILDAYAAVTSPDTTAPAAPSGLTATAAGPSRIDLDWADNTEADLAGYNVYRSDDGGLTFGQVAAGVAASSYSDTGLVAASTYFYYVTAGDTSGNESGASNVAWATTAAPDLEAPTAPSGLSATAVGSSRIDVDWADNAEADLAGYNVYRSADGAVYDQVAAGVSGSAYSDVGLAASATYYYFVTATDTSGNESAPSGGASATTEEAPPALSVTSITPNSMAVGTTIQVTVTGTGFSAGAVLTFANGAGKSPQAANIVVVDANTITADVTAGKGGPPRDRVWDVVVTNPGGASSSLAGGFTVTP
ncbi:MAG: S8 family serine peptidase [Planctomycetes bacterium]|nr:S8 family serine peptidase [Planctomycetota bacterium]